LSPESIEAVAQAATRAFRERRFNDAAAGYERCVAMNPKAPAFHFNLGTAREFGGDLPGAIKAYLSAWNLDPSDGRLALFAGAALAAAGRREDAAILFSLGDDVDPAVRQAKDRPHFDSEFRRRSETADRVMRELFTNLHEDAVAEFERHVAQIAIVRILLKVYNVANAYHILGRQPEAKRIVLRALEAAPSYEKAQELLLKITGQ